MSRSSRRSSGATSNSAPSGVSIKSFGEHQGHSASNPWLSKRCVLLFLGDRAHNVLRDPAGDVSLDVKSDPYTSTDDTRQMGNHFIRDAARISPNPRGIMLHTPVAGRVTYVGLEQRSLVSQTRRELRWRGPSATLPRQRLALFGGTGASARSHP